MAGSLAVRSRLSLIAATLLALPAPTALRADAAADRAAMAEVGALDTEYQAAVKANDAATMDRILMDDFTLVIGVGKVFDKKALVDSARNQDVTYTHQEEIADTQTVRVHGDTAVVTALLWIVCTPKGGGAAQDYKLWFSDTYVRTPQGWRYFFGQAAQRLSQ